MATMSKAHADWLARRMKGLGASEAAAVLGVSPYAGPLEVWMNKRGLIDDDLSDVEHVDAGNRLEPVIVQWFKDRTGAHIENPGKRNMFWHKDGLPIFATPDRLIVDDPEVRTSDLGVGVLEVKNTGEFSGDEWDDGAPTRHEIQLQHQMAAMDLRWGRIAVLIGGNRLRYTPPIMRNDAFIETMIEVELRFWREHVVDGREPDASRPVDMKALARLHPNDNGETVVLDGTWLDVDEELVAAKAARKAAEQRIEELEARIKGAIAPRTFAVMPSGVRYSWKTQERSAYSVEAKSYRVLRRKAGK